MSVEVHWIPLGAGERVPVLAVSARLLELLGAVVSRRRRRIVHAALVVAVDGQAWSVEMTPEWKPRGPDTRAVFSGPVGLPLLGRSRLFRYEVRRVRGGVVPDREHAVATSALASDEARARSLLREVGCVPPRTWGLTVHGRGMWTSNSVVAWVAQRSGHDLSGVDPPPGCVAPGWASGRDLALTATRSRRPRCRCGFPSRWPRGGT